MKKWFYYLGLIFLTTACAQSTPYSVSELATQTPIPTQHTKTIETSPTATLLPTLTLTPLPPLSQPTVQENVVLEEILITSPGEGSFLTSPINLEGEADPTFEQGLVVIITDIDGYRIATFPMQIQADIGQRGPFSLEIPFHIALEQAGRIAVYDVSPEDGGLIHLNSINIILSADGTKRIRPFSSQNAESIQINYPAAGEEIKGNQISIKGLANQSMEGELYTMLCGEGGTGEADLICGTRDNILGSSIAELNTVTDGVFSPFNGVINYQVSELTNARLAVYLVSKRDGNVIHLASQNILLLP